MKKAERPTKRERLSALLTALIITAMAALALLIATGNVDSVKLFGICGFEQRHNMPCPFCGMTRSVGMFVTGNPVGSFKMQPAAAIMCIAITLLWFYSTARALGYPMTRTKRMLGRIRPLITAATIVIIILIGWAVSIYNYNHLPSP